jgi:hypothetical protein
VTNRPKYLLPTIAWVVFLAACGGPSLETTVDEVPLTPRRLVVWVDGGGIDAEIGDRLASVGVDQIVVHRGTVLLSGGAPVVQLRPAPPVGGPVPVAVVLEVRGLDDEDRSSAAEAVWASLEADFGDRSPAELILDLRDLGGAAPGFVERLQHRSGLAVVPLLSLEQLQTEAGRAVARAANSCIVPVFGTVGGELRGLRGMPAQPLAAKLEPIRDLGVKVRVAAALRPLTDPPTRGWAEDLDPLTDEANATIRRTSTLDRSFVVARPLSWGGTAFTEGQTIAVTWIDTARLNTFLAESHRVILPEIVGWDLVSLPPAGPNLGLDRDELIRYLGGEGPAPKVTVDIRRRGRSVAVVVTNPGPFRSAVTGFGNRIQIELASGSLVASSRGGFDRIVLGTMERGEWSPNPAGGPDAVRFIETYLAPGETIETGTVRLPSSRSRIVVRWQVQLSDGRVIGGIVE